MALREATGVSRGSVGKPDEGVTGSVHLVGGGTMFPLFCAKTDIR
jgi:hypothetical protein